MFKTLAVGIVFLGLISGCNQPNQPKQDKRTEATIPPVEVHGFESSSFSLYDKSAMGGTTALGQIFLPPKGHDLLIKVGFQCRSYNGLDVNVKLRISVWEGDRPNSSTLWESETVLVSKDSNGWVSFDVPHIKLISGQKYIAWLSMSGLQNEDHASFGVVSMGRRTTESGRQPNTWTSDYPEGSRAFWRQSNPDGQIDNITQAPWITDGSGENLHFKMVFENKEEKLNTPPKN